MNAIEIYPGAAGLAAMRAHVARISPIGPGYGKTPWFTVPARDARIRAAILGSPKIDCA